MVNWSSDFFLFQYCYVLIGNKRNVLESLCNNFVYQVKTFGSMRSVCIGFSRSRSYVIPWKRSVQVNAKKNTQSFAKSQSSEPNAINKIVLAKTGRVCVYVRVFMCKLPDWVIYFIRFKFCCCRRRHHRFVFVVAWWLFRPILCIYT